MLGKETVYTAMRLPALLSKAIDKWAEVVGVSRSEAIRRLIEAGLKRRPKSPIATLYPRKPT